jgi:hypothetical protein
MSGILNLLVGINNAVIILKDAYFNLVTLLLNTTSTNGGQNNTFLDSSTNNYAITRGGNATQGTFTPFSQTGWSNNFNGSTDYLTVTDTSNLRFGSGNFTIEAWVYRAASGAIQTIVSKGAATPTGYVFQISAANKLVFIDTSTSITGATTLAANTWYYVAVVRAGTGASQTTLYVNGASDATGTSATTFNQTDNLLVGADRSSLNFFNGYISNLRLSNTNRTITSTPTSALTADANTIFLSANINRFQYTDSTATFTNMAVTGTPVVQAFSPFLPAAAYSITNNGGALYLDGNGYLSVGATTPTLDFGTGDFYIESWIYPTLDITNQKFIDFRSSATISAILQRLAGGQIQFTNTSLTISSTNTAPLNAWTHVVASRSTGITRLFINGVLQGTGSADVATYVNGTNRPVIGARGTSTGLDRFAGYITTSKVIVGTGVTSVTVPTSPSASAGSNLYLGYTNSNIYDATAKNPNVTLINAQASTTQAKFGNTSLSFPGANSWLTIPDSTNLQMGTGDFTIEGWVYFSTAGVAYGLISKGTSTTGWSVDITTANKLQFNYTTSSLTGTTTLSINTWYYFAVVRSGSATGNLKLYSGTTGSTTLEATSGGAVTDNFNNTDTMLVALDRTSTNALVGYLDEVRITKGFARTVTSVPGSAFPVQ